MLSRPDDFVLRVVHEFTPVSQPADHSWNHEKDWEHVCREAHGLVDDSTVEIDIRIKLSFNEIGVRKSDSF